MRKRKKKYKARTDVSSKAKKVAKVRIRKTKQPKTMNNGTMTSTAFWQMIRHVLRKRTIYWLPILYVKNRAKIAYKGPNKRRKFSYICEGCGGEFSGAEVNVHHKIPAGSLMKAEDLAGFVTRLFCEKEDLSLLCSSCHEAAHEKKD